MLFRELINAINSLRDSVLVLAQAVRESWAGVDMPEYDEKELFAKIQARIAKAEKENLQVEPTGAVFYASEDAGERQSYSEEIEQYLRDRGYGPEAVDSVKGLVGK